MQNKTANWTSVIALADFCAMVLASSAAGAITLTSNPISLALVAGNSGEITFTFTDDTAVGVYINHVNVVRSTNTRLCGAFCIQPITYSDSTPRPLNAGESYSYEVAIVPLAGVVTKSKTTTGTSTVMSKIWWEYNIPHRGHIIPTTTDLVNVTVSAAGDASAPHADNVLFSAVPEPTAWTLMLAGFGGVGVAMRRRARAAA